MRDEAHKRTEISLARLIVPVSRREQIPHPTLPASCLSINTNKYPKEPVGTNVVYRFSNETKPRQSVRIKEI